MTNEHTAFAIIGGEPAVGKSCLYHRFIGDTFSERYTTTINVDCETKLVEVDGIVVQILIWDSSLKQIEWGLITPMF